MISMVQPLYVGNALRLFFEPPAGAVRWKVLRKGSDSFSGHDDPSAAVIYEGAEHVVVDTQFLQNQVMAFYRPFYTSDGVTWAAGPTAHGTPDATFTETATDVVTFLRERLEAGLKVEVERGNLQSELGYVQVYISTPSLEQDLRFPLVTIHLDDEAASVWGVGDDITGDVFDPIAEEFEESEGWLNQVQCSVIGWSLNGDERSELRKAIRRIIMGNLQVFASHGWEQIELAQQHIDAVGGEYPAPIFQTVGSFRCLAPARVGGQVGTVKTVISRSIPL